VSVSFVARQQLGKDVPAKLKQTKLSSLSPPANYTDRATPLVGEVVSYFAGRGCHMISVADPYTRILGAT
jgi:hypothetical protein